MPDWYPLLEFGFHAAMREGRRRPSLDPEGKVLVHYVVAAMREGRRRPSLTATFYLSKDKITAAMREGRRRPSLLPYLLFLPGGH